MDHGTYLKSVFGLEGKTVMITGAAGGTVRPSARGWPMPERKWPCAADAGKVPGPGGSDQCQRRKASAYHLDVSDMSEIVPRVEEIVARYGKIDVLFNVAGINKREAFWMWKRRPTTGS